MEAPHLERKLVAILAADIEGFSSHMERDEAGTLAVLSSHRLIIDASIAEFGGRITSTAGDSVLAEFASVVSVINCAVQIQDLLADENAELEEAQRLFLRIGINVGDVMMKDGDIFGDGVNIAARLETLAEPGGICVSRGVREHLRKHPIAFADLGEQKVRNIAQPSLTHIFSATRMVRSTCWRKHVVTPCCPSIRMPLLLRKKHWRSSWPSGKRRRIAAAISSSRRILNAIPKGRFSTYLKPASKVCATRRQI